MVGQQQCPLGVTCAGLGTGSKVPTIRPVHLTRGTAGRVCCCGHLTATQIGVGSRWSVWQRWWLLLDTTLASLFDQMPFYR